MIADGILSYSELQSMTLQEVRCIYSAIEINNRIDKVLNPPVKK